MSHLVQDRPAQALAERDTELLTPATQIVGDTDAYLESLHLTREPAVKPSRYGGKRVTDRLVWTDDPNALSIEHGHLQGERGSGERKFIPGLFIFNRAADRFR